MPKDPAFLFYSADFLVGVMDLTDEETGQYIKLICLQHQKGRLTKKAIKIAFPNISSDVLAKFEIDENGLYYNPRVEEEIEKRNKYIDAQRSNGSKGGRPPKCSENPKETHGLHLAKPNKNPSEIEIVNEYVDNIDNDNLYNIEDAQIDVQTGVQNVQKDVQNAQFDEFWCAYPKKMNKERARCAFVRIKPSEQLFAQMLEALRKHKQSKQWQDAQYIPYPSTWLNGKRWEDELEETDEPSNSTFNTDEFFQAAVQRGRRQ